MLDVSNIQTLVVKEFNRGDLILASKYNELLKSLETIANYCNFNCNYSTVIATIALVYAIIALVIVIGVHVMDFIRRSYEILSRI